MTVQNITGALSLLLRLATVYFAVIALFALKKPKPFARCAPKTRFACLIAARNEEAVIGEIVASLLAQQYPRVLFDIWVIPNNCTDGTEQAARKAGARIFRCPEPVRCKGDALRQVIGWLLPQQYDAFCVFDADNFVDPAFLARMNDAMCAGAGVCKGALRAKNAYESWIAGCYGLYFTSFDWFFSRARMNCGLSAKLVGTGFAVRREVLCQLGGWPTETIAEDAEFSALCASRNIRIWFVPEAVTWDEGPHSMAVSLRQRLRWCSGVMDVGGRLRPALLRQLGRPGGRKALDSLLALHTPLFRVFGALVSGVALTERLFSPGGQAGWLPLLGSAAAAWLLSCAAGAFLAWLGGYRDRRIWKTVALFPLFMAEWLPLQMISLVHRTRSWKPIAHTGAGRVRALERE